MSDVTPPWPRIAGPLDAINDDFHAFYDDARSAAAEAPPVLILLGDALIVYLSGQRREIQVTPRLYHAIKSASHAPIALYAILYKSGDDALDAAAITRLRGLHAHTLASLAHLPRDVEHAEALADLRQLFADTLALIERTVAAARASRSALLAFARQCGPLLLRLMDHATGIQLQALHRGVEAALAPLSRAQQAALQVVVAGPHQARERSLAMQYFRKRLGEPSHTEERVAYAENAVDEQAALALVGTRRFDRAIAAAFFGDEHRLQRDLLGDAAAARLAGIEPGPAELPKKAAEPAP
jgi:hypothetical protein